MTKATYTITSGHCSTQLAVGIEVRCAVQDCGHDPERCALARAQRTITVHAARKGERRRRVEVSRVEVML